MTSHRPNGRSKRTDTLGRAFVGSQLHLQVWANHRTNALSSAITKSLGLAITPAEVEWRSPRADNKYREFRDGAFLRAIGQEEYDERLRTFWPRGGPVWDGLAIARNCSGSCTSVFLIEAKSYPNEVRGRGCQAAAGSEARRKIESSLSATARWLGVQETNAWMGELYQSANRLAHVYFLRERVGLAAYLLNVCFTADPRTPTSREQWSEAHQAFWRELGLAGANMPWLADVVLPAATRSEFYLR